MESAVNVNVGSYFLPWAVSGGADAQVEQSARRDLAREAAQLVAAIDAEAADAMHSWQAKEGRRRDRLATAERSRARAAQGSTAIMARRGARCASRGEWRRQARCQAHVL